MESETTLPAELQVDENVANDTESVKQQPDKETYKQANSAAFSAMEISEEDSELTAKASEIAPEPIIQMMKPDWPELSQKDRCAEDMRKYMLYRNDTETVTIDACSALQAISESKMRPLKIIIPCFTRQVLISPQQLSFSS